MNRRMIVWFRLDLRVHDNPALSKAVEQSNEIIPLFIWCPEEEGAWAAGAASNWWLHHSIASLQAELGKINLRLILRKGRTSKEVLDSIISEHSVAGVFWNRRYEPLIIERDTKLKTALTNEGVQVQTFNAALLSEPWEVKTKSGGPYQVYTPFMKAYGAADPPRRPLPAPPASAATPDVQSLSVDDLQLMPKIDWAQGLRDAWEPGTTGARKSLTGFIEHSIHGYSLLRNVPGQKGTSRLSPHLHFGEISPHEVWHEVSDRLGTFKELASSSPDARIYLQEIIWREFGYHLLFHFPETTDLPLRKVFEHFPWEDDDVNLRAWQRGMTGYPIVDAGMRELWQTGWMHNRVRMIVASFLVKNLLISWQAGATWFWDTLVDADLASNTLGWQWSAGCGADAAPYFRVFNPVLQGEKFDPEGEYVRRFVPELQALSKAFIHKPWVAGESVLRDAGIQLGSEYPRPIVDLADSREAALKAYATLKAFK